MSSHLRSALKTGIAAIALGAVTVVLTPAPSFAFHIGGFGGMGGFGHSGGFNRLGSAHSFANAGHGMHAEHGSGARARQNSQSTKTDRKASDSAHIGASDHTVAKSGVPTDGKAPSPPDKQHANGRPDDTTPPSTIADKGQSKPKVTTRVDPQTGIVTTIEISPTGRAPWRWLIKKTMSDPRNGYTRTEIFDPRNETTTIIKDFPKRTVTEVTNPDGTVTYVKTDKATGQTVVRLYDKDDNLLLDLSGNDDGIKNLKHEDQKLITHFVDQQTGNKIEITVDVSSGVRTTATFDANDVFISEETYDPETEETTVVGPDNGVMRMWPW